MDLPIFHPKILIVDDEPFARKRLRNLLHDITAFYPHMVCGEADSIVNLNKILSSIKPDLIFLDINMPDGSGIDFVKSLAVLDFEIIFLTARDDCALEAFNLNAVDYLLKPIKSDRLLLACEKALVNLKNKRSIPALKIIERGQIILVPVSDIIYCQADLKYTTLKTKTNEYISNDSLIHIEESYKEWFTRIHRGILVNKLFISKLYKSNESWLIDLKSDTNAYTLPVSRRQLPILKQYIKTI